MNLKWAERVIPTKEDIFKSKFKDSEYKWSDISRHFDYSTKLHYVKDVCV